jgi:hypothetical protein
MVIQILKNKNYLEMAKNAASGQNNMFRNVYASVDGQEKDITRNGALSCAFFVSSILYLNKLIKDVHTGVVGLERDLLDSGWKISSEMKEGAVIIWEPRKGKDGIMHTHAGFYIGTDMSVSNDSDGNGVPGFHHYTFGYGKNGEPVRKIEKIYLPI